MTITFDLNRLIQIRLAEIAEVAWEAHRILPVTGGEGRVLDLGSAAVRELWTCGADHGSGICGEPLLTHRQAAALQGLFNVDEPVLDPKLPATDIDLLDEEAGGFTCGSVYHYSDVRREFGKAQGRR